MNEDELSQQIYDNINREYERLADFLYKERHGRKRVNKLKGVKNGRK